MREVCEVTEFFVNDKNHPESNTIYKKNIDGTEIINSPSSYLIDYLESQGVDLKNQKILNEKVDLPFSNDINKDINDNSLNQSNVQNNNEYMNSEINNNQVNNLSRIDVNSILASDGISNKNGEIEELL
jgi:GTP1/Obg family GTP-binding protein